MAENELKLYSCEYIMDTAMTRNKFIVDKMLYSGLYILAGAPKVGKSWLVHFGGKRKTIFKARDQQRVGAVSRIGGQPFSFSEQNV